MKKTEERKKGEKKERKKAIYLLQLQYYLIFRL